MAQSQYSLSWEDHPKNICNGLSYLQQNGEFVDMTLAADGYHVKVHQVIIALSSPYLKDLIASAQCPNPVIVINKISHTTLSSILEYIYTGEVRVGIEDLRDLIDAAKELRIKGLQDMNLSVTKPANQHKANELIVGTDSGCVNMDDEDNISYYEINRQITSTDNINRHDPEKDWPFAWGDIKVHKCVHRYTDIVGGSGFDPWQVPFSESINETGNTSLLHHTSDCDSLYAARPDAATVVSQPFLSEVKKATILTDTNPDKKSSLQYTISTHGSLQLILNRFLYYLKNTRLNHTRQWRCVDYLRPNKCPAVVITKNNVVLQRIKAHKHPFHDGKILKKVKDNNVFSELVDAEQSGAVIKKQDPDDYAIDSE